MQKAILLGCILAGLLACSSATESPAAADAAPALAAPKVGEVVVDVAYTGTKDAASLSVALFTEFPPKGPPAGVGQTSTPKFPQTLRVQNVAPGTYVAVVRLTARGNDPQAQSAQPGDVQAASKPFTLGDKEGMTTAVELVDK